MSRESLEKFFQLIAENKECKSKAESFDGNADALAAYARELGYDISAAELREYREQAQQLIKSRMQKLQESEPSLSPGVKEFYKLIELSESDEEVAKRIEELSSGTKKELIAYGKEKGFIFDEEDMKSAANEMIEPKNELSEKELERVAGGVLLVGLGLGVASAAVLCIPVLVASAVGIVVGAVTSEVFDQ